MTKNARIGTVLVAATGLLLFNACNHRGPDYAANDPIYKNLDTTVKPGDDFFRYANGAWLKKNPIPAAYASWGIGNVVEEDIRDRLKKINEDALNQQTRLPGSSTQKIGDFYFQRDGYRGY
jgi:putative endopeptidase